MNPLTASPMKRGGQISGIHFFIHQRPDLPWIEGLLVRFRGLVLDNQGFADLRVTPPDRPVPDHEQGHNDREEKDPVLPEI